MLAARPLDRNDAPRPEPPRAGHFEVGQPFNPWRGSCGFYPPDCLSRLRGVVILSTRHRLTDGHKNLFARLVRRAGQDGLCFPSYESLAGDLGRSVRQVKTWVADLEAFGLIRHRRRGRGHGGRGLENEYTFLWHEIYKARSSARLRVMKCNPGTFEVQDFEISKCNDERPLYKEETRTEETRTPSSDRDRGRIAGQPSTQVSASARCEFENKPQPPPPTWPCGGWASEADFDAWWIPLVRRHPNRNRNAEAKRKALDLISTGVLTRGEFDAGYAAAESRAGERWTEQYGRFAPNLSRFLDDRAWQQPVHRESPAAYRSADEYWKGLNGE